jgi:predicted MFS family arabinose efflux permease
VIDDNLRGMLLVSISLFIVAGVVFIVGEHSLAAVLVAIVLWGLAFGGAATQLQTAIGKASGENADVANSMLTVSFNLAIFAAGVGGALVIGVDPVALPIVMVILAAVALFVVAVSRRSAFPVGR